MSGFLPNFLRPGDTIGLFSPAGPVRDQQRAEDGVKILQHHGFFVRMLRPLVNSTGYLAGKDSERADELHRLLADEEVKGLLAVRGGFGCLRMLHLLDYDFIAAHPKPIVGFSDLSALLNTISQKTGLVTLHGPVLTSLASADQSSIASFFGNITGNFQDLSLGNTIEVLRPGTGTGVIRGGNLTTLMHLLATPWELEWEGSILFLEDTGEEPYRLDRMLTQLTQANKLAGLAGLILGEFDVGGDDRLANLRLQEDLWHRVLELTQGQRFPIWANFPLGHQRRNNCLPIGLGATMDSDRAVLALGEPA